MAGDKCRVCGGPPPPPVEVWTVWVPTLVQIAAEIQVSNPRWRHTIGSTNSRPRHDWICLGCQAWAARAEGIAA